MGENTKYFWGHLPIVGVFTLAAATTAAVYTSTADYTTYASALKVYSVGWFAACVLSFYCGLLVVPRSLGIVFSFAGTAAFALVCAMDTGIHTSSPILAQIIQALPAAFLPSPQPTSPSSVSTRRMAASNVVSRPKSLTCWRAAAIGIWTHQAVTDVMRIQTPFARN